MKESLQKPNWFVRILILIYVLILIGLVFVSFINSQPSYSINSGIILLLGIITIVILSEAFNNLSLGKLITLSRQVGQVESEKEELKQANAELLNRLIQVTHLVSNVKQYQSSSNTPINITSLDIAQALGQAIGVVKAPEEDEDELHDEIEQTEIPSQISENAEPTREEQLRNSRIRYLLFRKIEEDLLNRYLSENELDPIDLQKDIQFTDSFKIIDPIMERRVVFDGYVKTGSKEYFIETRIGSYLHPQHWDRLYVMLSKILYYRQAKNIQAELILILAKIPEDAKSTFLKSSFSIERFLEAFQPAIANNLLRVEIFEYSSDEYQKAIDQILESSKPNTTLVS